MGENFATEVIQASQPQLHLSSVIVPSDRDQGRVRETDHLVLWAGTVFIVEIKNYTGTLRWAGDGSSELIQMKVGNYGEAIPPKPARNPEKQARDFVRVVKKCLATYVDKRFECLTNRVGSYC